MRFLGVAVLALVLAVPTAEAATPGEPPALSLYAVALESKALKRLEFGEKPSLSRDGRFLATFSKGLTVRRIDGTGLRRLTGSPLPDGAIPGETITWSPDGKQLAFDAVANCSAGRCTDSFVYVVNRDGTGLHRIGEGRSPSWSPRGSRIAIETRIEDDRAHAIALLDGVKRQSRVIAGGAARFFKTPHGRVTDGSLSS